MCELSGDKLQQATDPVVALFPRRLTQAQMDAIHQTYLDNLAVDAEQAEEEDPWSTQA